VRLAIKSAVGFIGVNLVRSALLHERNTDAAVNASGAS
jgi:hypothetical protein